MRNVQPNVGPKLSGVNYRASWGTHLGVRFTLLLLLLLLQCTENSA